jgi:hypothetical protein
MLCFSGSSGPKQLIFDAVCDLAVNDVDVNDEGVVVCASNDRTVRAWSVDGKVQWVSKPLDLLSALVTSVLLVDCTAHRLRHGCPDQQGLRCQRWHGRFALLLEIKRWGEVLGIYAARRNRQHFCLI